MQLLDVGIVPLVCSVPVNYTINTDTVLKLLAKINVSKATGPDDIPGWILRDHALTLAHPVYTIFNASIREGFFPSNWKSANVIPIPKVNPPHMMSKDLRPISLTAVLPKLLERIVGGWMLDLMFDRPDSSQYGQLKDLSSTHTRRLLSTLDWVGLKGSVPQGPWLCTLLLIIRIKDLHPHVLFTSTWMIPL